MKFAEALELEVKKVSFRGVRMSRRQRRDAATRGVTKNQLFLPKPGETYDPDGVSIYSGPKAKRATGQAARKKRLAAMGIGPAKPSKRMKEIQRVRSDLMGARSRARTWIDANRG